MNIVMWLVVGAMIGWLASILMKVDGERRTLVNVVVGLMGALAAGLAVTPVGGVESITRADFSWPSLLVPLTGAVVLLVAVAAFRRGTGR
jgi:uncharacterized membrane protein YeaQ/YmgE (transglycosylase-associated protein family)